MQEHPTAVDISPEPIITRSAPIPEPRGDHHPSFAAAGRNDSGTGPTAVLPAELQGFSWAAFLLHWIWSLGHNTWIGLLALIVPFPIMNVILGLKGNEWAWQNRRWDSLEQFRATQRVWLMWGIGLLVFSVIILVAFFGLIAWVMMASGALNEISTQTRATRPPVR